MKKALTEIEWWTTEHVSEYFHIPQATLRWYRSRGTGPLHDCAVQMGPRTVRYHGPTLIAAMKAQLPGGSHD